MLVAVPIAILVLAACGEETPPTPTPTATPEPTPTPVPQINRVSYDAGEYSFSGPVSVPAGWTELTMVNTGQELHHLQLIRLTEGKTIADLAAVFLQEEEGPTPSWMEAVGGASIALPGGSSNSTVKLEEGNYVFLCFLPDPKGVPHAALGMVSPLTVTAAAGPEAPAPEADLTIDMFDFGYTLSDPIGAGAQTIKLTNSGPQDHEMAVVQMAPGATPEEVLASFEPGLEGPPAGMPGGGLQALKAGGEAFVDLNFTAGSSYLLVCFIPDVETGAPHFTLGMLEVVAIP